MLKSLENHYLDTLLAPKSIAFLGASTRPDSPGNSMVRMAMAGDHGAAVWPVNPRYEEVEGLPCFGSLAELPQSPDHVAIGLGTERLVSALEATIEAGAQAATIFASSHDPAQPHMERRLADMAREAGINLCGPNGMGFYNLQAGLRICGFPAPTDLKPGGIAWIAQSGSVFAALAHNDRRPRFNLCVSSGAEIVTTAADYLDWALHQPSTRVVALFLETVRDPQRFEQALALAESHHIPVVVLKVGRSEAAARMALTHTGAIAGNDGAYEALFHRYGVIRTRTLDEMTAVLLLLQGGRKMGNGSLATMHDSGGEREMIADLADDIGIKFADLDAATVKRLEANLDPGLEPDNPLDAWGTGHRHEEHFTNCLHALIEDPNVALAGMFFNLRRNYYLHEVHTKVLRNVAQLTEKPLFLATNYSMVDHRELALELTESGIPVLDGTEETLLAVRHVLNHHAHQNRERAMPAPACEETVVKWHHQLAAGKTLPEAEGLALLADFGIDVPASQRVSSLQDALASAQQIGWPVALKTAAADIHHKSDVGGVVLNLLNDDALTSAYTEMSERLGPEVLVSAMAPKGVEIALGAVLDAQFGPCIMLSAGGTLVEFLNDRVFVQAPVHADDVVQLLSGMKINTLLEGVRGARPVDMDALATSVERFSVMIASLADVLQEADLNPLIAGPEGTTAVDALIVSRAPGMI